ncbi:YtxH domain-containing protein [Robertkochia aurantiaca]|uniref:YtxH domain-containing protein n=1 Tax=Robertkochia aurantiaca TaxID=2873700 RepID=UPI001CCA1105|nr:YtxH domain-containing protein [Robertkochia sp. 3YJGBD-33]
MSNNTGNTVLALLTGAAIGAGLGILYAPDRGDETRRKISKNAKKAQKDLERTLKQTTDEIKHLASSAKMTFDDKLDHTIESASYKADDVIDTLERKLAELKAKNAKLQKSKAKVTS